MKFAGARGWRLLTGGRLRGSRPPSGARERVPGIGGITRDIVLEGLSADERIGAFRGRALATALVAADSPDAERSLFLVDDPRKPAPVWVRQGEIRRSGSGLRAGEPVMGYVTVGVRDEPESVAAIETACRESEWRLIDIVRDRGATPALERPGLSNALTRIARGDARGLIVPDLRRLTRSMADLGALLQWFRDARATLVALDLGLDTGTTQGDEIAAMMITVSDWQRDLIAERTRDARARLREEGRTWGRPSLSDRPELFARITDMRRQGMTLQAIADRLNAEGVPTTRGGSMWRPSSVQAAIGYRRPSTRRPRGPLPSTSPDGDPD
jgi:DNA invertase Pin-like site-specific DNA recombinase